MLPTPGAAYGAWSILDALLAATGPGTPFIFKEPLGQAREVKVALSGLFGRFVARAYLERYLNLSIFAHLTSRSLLLDGRRRIDIVRRSRGDLPDWVARRDGRPSSHGWRAATGRRDRCSASGRPRHYFCCAIGRTTSAYFTFFACGMVLSATKLRMMSNPCRSTIARAAKLPASPTMNERITASGSFG